MNRVVEITDIQFDEEVLASDVPTAVDFWAPWCQPCLRVSPLYDRLSREYGDRFKFCKIDVDQNQFSAMKYQISSIPMLMFFVDGQKVNEILGAVPESVVRATVEETMRRFPVDSLGRFKAILAAWTEQNKLHSEKLRRWTAKNNDADRQPLYQRAIKAAWELETANEHLYHTMVELEKFK